MTLHLVWPDQNTIETLKDVTLKSRSSHNIIINNIFYGVRKTFVFQLLTSPALYRPTLKPATASPWSSHRFLGQPATSWEQREMISSLRPWSAAPQAPWCSSSPTQTTSSVSCLSTQEAGASPQRLSLPGQVQTETKIPRSYTVVIVLQLMVDQHRFIRKL